MGKISEMLAGGRTFSFELMPPRNPEAQAQLKGALIELEALRPSFVSITYGAGGSTRDRTHQLVNNLLTHTTMTPMAHLTCSSHSRAELTEIIEMYQSEGLENLLALRGDPPLGQTVAAHNDMPLASDLVELVRSLTDFSVGVAVHPEGHRKATDEQTDRKHQAAKLATADFAITQLFFRASDYFQFVDDMSALGVEKPVIPGIMPPTNLAQLARMGELSGADIPQEVAQRLEKAGEKPADVRKAGVEIATELCEALLAEGAPGLHFFTMNKSTATREIYANLGLAPKPLRIHPGGRNE